MAENRLEVGSILLQRYQIASVLHQDDTKVIYKARDLIFPEQERYVALKEIHYLGSDPTQRTIAVRTFQREANVLATLYHPAVPTIYDFFDQNNRVYLVTELINGTDLEELLYKTTSLPIPKIMEWSIALCDLLTYLHTMTPTIILRVLKPSSIMIDAQGKLRMINFSLSITHQKGQKGALLGKEGYSSPEQYDGDPSPLSDIYNLGATMHHILTRQDPRLRRPFSFLDHPVRRYNPDVPAGLASIVERAVAYKPEDRFQSAGEMQASIQRVLDNPDVELEGTRHIFLSYSRKDIDMMKRLRNDLRDSGVTVWTDENLTPGTEIWEAKIAEAIENAGALVVILSADAKQSTWIARELSYAEGHKVRIFPLLASGDERSAIPFRLVTTQYIDITQDYEGGLRKLLAVVRKHLLEGQ